MNIEQIEGGFKRLTGIHDKKVEKFTAWFKSLITIAAGLIAVLVSLKTEKSPTSLAHYLFVVTIGLLSLGILAGSLVLYNEVHVLEKTRAVQLDYIKKLLDDPSADLMEWITDAWYFVPAKWISLVSFLVSLITLTWYATLIDV